MACSASCSPSSSSENSPLSTRSCSASGPSCTAPAAGRAWTSTSSIARVRNGPRRTASSRIGSPDSRSPRTAIRSIPLSRPPRGSARRDKPSSPAGSASASSPISGAWRPSAAKRARTARAANGVRLTSSALSPESAVRGRASVSSGPPGPENRIGRTGRDRAEVRERGEHPGAGPCQTVLSSRPTGIGSGKPYGVLRTSGSTMSMISPNSTVYWGTRRPCTTSSGEGSASNARDPEGETVPEQPRVPRHAHQLAVDRPDDTDLFRQLRQIGAALGPVNPVADRRIDPVAGVRQVCQLARVGQLPVRATGRRPVSARPSSLAPRRLRHCALTLAPVEEVPCGDLFEHCFVVVEVPRTDFVEKTLHDGVVRAGSRLCRSAFITQNWPPPRDRRQRPRRVGQQEFRDQAGRPALQPLADAVVPELPNS